MAYFGQKHGLTRLKKNAIFWTLEYCVFYSQRGFFSLFIVIKHYFKSYFDQI